MNNSVLEKIIRGYLHEVIHMSLATSQDNKPWITEVHFSYDSDLNLYFLSRPSRRHSKEIVGNNIVAGNIIKQHSIGEKVTGIYFEGVIKQEPCIKENDPAYVTYRERFSLDETILKEQYEENGHTFYSIQVQKFYIFDESHLNPSGKYELHWN